MTSLIREVTTLMKKVTEVQRQTLAEMDEAIQARKGVRQQAQIDLEVRKSEYGMAGIVEPIIDVFDDCDRIETDILELMEDLDLAIYNMEVGL